jgi:4-amino-4-deoxy-L-arabinose transferase-like glycosyltransferase
MSRGMLGASGAGPAAGTRASRVDPRLLDAIVLGGLLVLAALLRLPDLVTRGTFDGDQGWDAGVVREMVRAGSLPLLGPSTSIGEFHHGAAYYYLLAPAAIPSGGDDPVALALLIAMLGTAAVGVTWWLARAIAGPVAGLVAGGLLAVSTGAVDGSTFIWNPNPIPFFAALALAAAWRAHGAAPAADARPRWWLVAGAAQGMVQQLHVLGVVGLVPLVALWLHAWRRAPGERRRLARAGAGALALIAVFYLPLLLHELQSGFSETAAALAWLTGGAADGPDDPGLVARLAIVPLRILAWPLVGPLVAAGAVAILAVAAWAAAVSLGLLRARGPERTGLAWLAGSVVVSTGVLALGVRSLAWVTPLPNDHYHAFLWPAITGAAGVAVAVLVQLPAGARAAVRAALVGGLGLAVLALAGWNLARQPPAVAADGGWPAAEEAGRSVISVVADAPTTVLGVPANKKTGALDYPLTVLGAPPVAAGEATHAAVLCDQLFEEVVGLECRGPAEEARLAEAGLAAGELLTRFEAAPGRWISVYEIAGR